MININLKSRTHKIQVRHLNKRVTIKHSGTPGVGVPIGGTIGQVLAKNSNTNYDTEWVDQTGGGDAQTYDEFIYNSSGTQEDNRFNDWADLYTALSSQEGQKRITFEQSETLPAGEYSMNNVSLWGNGLNVFTGGITVTLVDGFTLVDDEWENGGIDGGLNLLYAGTEPLVKYSSGFHTFTCGYASGIQSSVNVFFALTGTARLFMHLVDGASIFNAGYELISVDDTVLVYVIINGIDSGVASQVFRGDKSTANIAIYVNSPSSNINPDRTDSNLTGGAVLMLLGANAYLLNYLNNTSGLSATNVQDAIDELASSGGAQTYDNYIYNSSGAQSGNRYNSWSDLMAEVSSGQEGQTRITFEQNETLPVGTWNLDYVIFCGDGSVAVLGGLVITIPDGFVLGGSGEWVNGSLEGGIGIEYTANTTLITYSAGIKTFSLNFGNVIACTNASFFDINAGVACIFRLNIGSQLMNDGYEPVTIESGGMNYVIMGSSNATIGNDIFRGEVDSGAGLIIVDSPASAVDPARTDANLTGSYFVNLASNAYNVAFNAGMSGMTSTDVNSAIIEAFENATPPVTPDWGDIGGTLSDQTDLQSALDGKLSTTAQKMRLIGSYSFGSDNINFYDGSPSMDIDSYTPVSGDVLRVRTGGSRSFGAGGTLYAEERSLLYYDHDEWRLIYNPDTTIGAMTANSLLATANTMQIQSLNTASYPSLTEISFVKGVTSAIQTQINAKISASSTDTLTNKTFDANGTGNSISNLETADFASNVVDTDATMASNSDTRLATQKATRTIIHAKTAVIAPTSGDYYSMVGPTSAGSPGSVTAGKLLCHPIMLDIGTLDRIAVSTSVAAVSTWRLGLYKADPVTGLPDGQTPFLDAGTVDMNASPGVQAITISKAITEPGLYWAVVVVDAYTAAPTTHNVIYSNASGGGIQGLPQDMSSLGRFRVGRVYGSTVSTGSIPTCPTGLAWAGVTPRIAVRYA